MHTFVHFNEKKIFNVPRILDETWWWFCWFFYYYFYKQMKKGLKNIGQLVFITLERISKEFLP